MRRWQVVAGCVSAILALATEVQAQDTIRVNLQRKAQAFSGFGAHIWPGDQLAMQTLAEMGMKYARIDDNANFFYFPNQPPTDDNSIEGDNFDEMLTFITRNFDTPDGRPNLSYMRTTADLAQRQGVQLIQTVFHIPKSFVDANNALKTNSIDDFATYWAAMMTFLVTNGVQPSFVELSNEPNGNWSGYISPIAYDALVIKTRHMLDVKGHQSIGIVGPGLSILGVANWVASLSPAAVTALGAWSAHTWDDSHGLESRLSTFMSSVRIQDPAREKRVFMTEFATIRLNFNGAQYTYPETGGNAADQSPFAVWVLSNITTLVNNGADTLVYWDAVDQSWSVKKWGLRRVDGSKRPTFDALKMLASVLPPDAKVLEKVWQDPSVNVAAFLGTDKLVLCLTNTSNVAQARTIALESGPTRFRLESANQFHASAISPVAIDLNADNVTTSLLPESAQVIVFSLGR